MTYSNDLLRFCEYSHITPDEFQNTEPKRARDIAWDFVETLMDKPSVAVSNLSALKSFYRNKDGVQLPFDGSKFGKHRVQCDGRKSKIEHVPSKAEVYAIVDAATSLRDKAMLLTLFQSGIRENALMKLTYGMVREQLENGTCPLTLKIDDTVDTKLKGYHLAQYITFIGKEAIEAIRRYLEVNERQYSDDSFLFQSSWRNAICATSIWIGFKRAVKRAGYDSRTMWVHDLRKAYKANLVKGNVQEELSECLMGHKLKNSRESYMNREDAIEELRKAYEQADFTRTGKTKEVQHDVEIERLKRELFEKNIDAQLQKERISALEKRASDSQGLGVYLNDLENDREEHENEIADLKTQMEAMRKQLSELLAQKSVNTVTQTNV
jgi:site-specific recombinase XerD